MGDAKRPDDIRFRVNLVDAARAQLRLLQEVDRHPNLYHNEHLLQAAIYRYEVLWLPLKAAFTQKDLVPPLDVHWVWHCHMLSPLRYRDDTYRVTRTVVEHRHMKNQKRYKEGQDNARGLWKCTYPSQRFEINIDAEWTAESVPEYKSKIGYDIISAVARQRVFYYQVALSHYKDRKFLQMAVARYKKYLFLKRNNIGNFLVPCYDFDLIWHAHQTHPGAYAEDCLSILDRILNHDDSVNDRTPSSKLSNCETKTRTLWSEAYQDSFAVPGAMYRGAPNHGFLYKESQEQIKKYSSSCIVTEIRSISILDYQPEGSCTYFSIYIVDKNSENVRVLHKRANQLTWPERRKRHYGRFQFKSSHHIGLRFCLEKKSPLCCCCSSQDSVIYSAEVSFQEAVGYESADSPRFPFSRTLELRPLEGGGGPVRVRVTGEVVADHRRACTLTLQPESTVREDLEDADWDPAPLVGVRGSKVQQSIRSLVGCSRLVNHENRVCYRVRVLHSTDVMTSAVYVSQEHGMLEAVAHSIGNDVIPTPSQVSDRGRHICLDPCYGERAMLVRDGGGDWAICVGRWVRGKHHKDRGTGDDGFLHLKIYHMTSGKISIHRLPRSPDKNGENNFRFHVAESSIDLQAGHIEISADAPALAPRIALSFSVSVLYLLCHPTDSYDVITTPEMTSPLPTANQEEVQLLSTNGGQSHQPRFHLKELVEPSGGGERKRKGSSLIPDDHVTMREPPAGDGVSDLTFLVASGYAYDCTLIPSNSFIYQSLASNQPQSNLLYGGAFGGHDRKHSAPGGSFSGGSFGGCSGDAADYGENGGEEGGGEGAGGQGAGGGGGRGGGGGDVGEGAGCWAEGGYDTAQGACGGCGGCAGCGGCGG